MKPFVVTGLPAVHSHVLYHPQPDPKAGPLHTTARPTSSKDVKDTPTLLIWSCVHGDLFVQAPKQVPVLPPISSFDFVFSPIPCSSSSNPRDRPSLTSLKRYVPVCPGHDPRSPPPAAALHSSPTPASRSQPMFPSGRPLPRQKQRPVFSSTAPYPAPGRLAPLSRRSSHNMNEGRPTAQFPVTRASGRNVPHVRPVPSSTMSPTAPSLSVFQPRHTPRTSNNAPRLRTSETVSEKRVCSDPTPGSSSVSTPGPSTSSSAASSSPATPPGSDDTAPCGFEDCDTTLTQNCWEKHYDTVHGISEKTWVTGSLCLHPACRKAQAKAVASATPRKQPKLTIGTWPTYKRHVKQMHFPKGRKYPCTFPGCAAALSRADALLRHVENRHKVVHAGRERAGKRTSTERTADSEEGPPRKKARVGTSPAKVRTPRAKPYANKTLGVHEKKASLAPASSTASRKGKEVARGGDSKGNRNPSFASGSSTVPGPSRIRIVDSEDVDMDDDEDEKMAQSEDEYDDEWPQGDIIEDEMNFDPDNYY
ncbi:hypothetical protein LXA43DRAFT_348931 [Ganoderma leucocontextum]|nr:hypothetical protein LXA43DRAFT_348931 [Ganoderma leucocontextum]